MHINRWPRFDQVHRIFLPAYTHTGAVHLHTKVQIKEKKNSTSGRDLQVQRSSIGRVWCHFSHSDPPKNHCSLSPTNSLSLSEHWKGPQNKNTPSAGTSRDISGGGSASTTHSSFVYSYIYYISTMMYGISLRLTLTPAKQMFLAARWKLIVSFFIIKIIMQF